jgi:hypothetical protein
MKLTSQMPSSTSLMPSFWPASTSGDVDPLAMKAESPACGDDDVAIVEWIGELWQAINGGSQLRIDFEQRQGRSR